MSESERNLIFFICSLFALVCFLAARNKAKKSWLSNMQGLKCSVNTTFNSLVRNMTMEKNLTILYLLSLYRGEGGRGEGGLLSKLQDTWHFCSPRALCFGPVCVSYLKNGLVQFVHLDPF